MPTATLSENLRLQAIGLSDGRTLAGRDRPLIMGVLNLTPDSFSDGGLWIDPQSAIDHAKKMIRQGADLLDLGAESSRPGGGVYGEGAEPISAQDELDRLLPVLEHLKNHTSIPISVDTRKGTVARAALGSGADVINDITCLGDPELAAAVADAGCPVVLMHSRGDLRSMQRDIAFDDVLIEVRDELLRSIERACSLGIDRHQIVIDPGIGFGKTVGQNLEILRRLDILDELGRPILVGASRKSFIGEISGSPATQRLSGSLAAVGWAARHHASVVRVHDVAETRQFLEVWQAIESSGESDRESS